MDNSQVVEQRIRNLIVDHLTLLTSPTSINEYQEKVPVNIVNELFEQWYDNVDFRIHLIENFESPTYTEEERVAILKVSSLMEYALSNTPDKFPDLNQFLVSAHYQLLSNCAKEALSVFLVRGKLSDDEPAT
ncbi:MAG: hypothetical protein ABJJ44_18690 [Paraglaciecola sp.]|uniref:hypothetical protein n=1 Tax=Paraglaciecola sp. TaxID=1920173 RepID=UPI0032986D57